MAARYRRIQTPILCGLLADYDAARDRRIQFAFAAVCFLLGFHCIGVWFYRSLVLMDSDRLMNDRGGGCFRYSMLLMYFAFVGVSFYRSLVLMEFRFIGVWF